jgi:hypothetical protein
VVFDALMERSPHSNAAASLWFVAEAKQVEALVPAHGVTTLFYLAARAKGTGFARRALGTEHPAAMSSSHAIRGASPVAH